MDLQYIRTSTGPIDCSQQENYSRFNDTQGSATCHVCLRAGAVVGLSFHVQTGLASLVALLGLAFVITRNYYRKCRGPNPGRWRLFRRNIDVLMLNIIVSDIVMSIGAILDIRWASEGQVYCGSYCNAQGVIKTMGETAAALSTLSVTVYTFVTLICPRPPAYSPWICSVVVATIWLWVPVWPILLLAKYGGPGLDEKGHVLYGYTPTPWWCWINEKYTAARIVAEYLWLWIAGVCTIALYVPAYLIARRKREPSRHLSEAADIQSVASSNDEGNEAVKLLWYPPTYTLCVLPLSVIRWASYVHPELLKRPEFLPASMFAICSFNLMGLINVVLIFWTRPAILLLDLNANGGSEEPLSRQDDSQQVETPNDEDGSNRFGGEEVKIEREM